MQGKPQNNITVQMVLLSHVTRCDKERKLPGSAKRIEEVATWTMKSDDLKRLQPQSMLKSRQTVYHTIDNS
jgi:hypothetical protein